jgi:hypothetical protein
MGAMHRGERSLVGVVAGDRRRPTRALRNRRSALRSDVEAHHPGAVAPTTVLMTCQREALLAHCRKGVRSASGNPRSAPTDGRSPGREPRPQATYIRVWDRGNPSLIGRGTAPPLPRLSEGPRWIWAPRAFDSAPRISTQPDTDRLAITIQPSRARHERSVRASSRRRIGTAGDDHR